MGPLRAYHRSCRGAGLHQRQVPEHLNHNTNQHRRTTTTMTDFNDQAPDFGDEIDPDDIYDWEDEEDDELDWDLEEDEMPEDDSDVMEVVSVKLSAGEDTGASLTLCLAD